MNLLQVPRYTIWWRGLIFIKGVPAGEPSLLRFAERVDRDGVAAACAELSGNFTAIVSDKSRGCVWAFTDHNRVSNLYYSDGYISTSFLQLAKTLKPAPGQLDGESVYAFILTGQVYSSHALYQGISFLAADELLVVEQNAIRRTKKNLPQIYDQTLSRAELKANLQEMIHSWQGKKISLDLSGGSDTRLLAGLLKQLKLDFELCTDCPPGFPDHTIAVKAAALLDRPHWITWHTVDESTLEQELHQTFLAYDGLSDILASHPTWQNYAKREARGIDLVISGFAGEMFKDGGWWRVAMGTLFTKNWKQKTIHRLVYSGLVAWGFDPNIPDHVFGEAYQKVSKNFKQTLYEFLLANYDGANRAELADKIFNEFSIRSPRSPLPRRLTYFPLLLDANILPFGLHLSFGRRLFAKEYRSLLFQADKRLARLETTKAGTSLSPEFSYLAADMVKFLIHTVNTRVLKKQKSKPINPLYAFIRRRPETLHYVDSLKNAGVLAASLSPQDLPDRYLGRVYSLGKLLEEMDHPLESSKPR